MRKLEEKKVEKRLTKFYSGSKKYVVRNQVRLDQKHIDIILMDKEGENHILSIEVKLYDWKTAVRQASLNTIACDRSYVAIWHEFAHRALNQKEIFEEAGIGLIVIQHDYTPRIEIESQKLWETNPLAYRHILSIV